MTAPETFIVRFPRPDGEGSAGAGALIGPSHVVTCAHVVNTALGLDQRAQGKPDAPVRIAFPFLPGGSPGLTARVAVWRPPPKPGAAGDDVAGLVIEGGLPRDAAPGLLAADPPRPGSVVRACGFPPGRPNGSWVETAVRGTVSNRRLQLDSGPDSALRVQPGFSGGPVVDDSIGRVAGIVAESATSTNDSYAISADVLRDAWPDVAGARGAGSPGTRTEVTILHVSGTRFGGADGPPPSDALAGRLRRDIIELGDSHGLRPDLLVVTGDLADGGLPGEYERATEFLAALAGSAGISRRHVAIVPGARDVNRDKCHGYFLIQKGEGAAPVPPYFPKWSPYAKAFEEFYSGLGAAFTPDEPWTLFEMPGLGVVVAGLNSTMAYSHRDSDCYGFLGEEQLRWFAGRLAEYRRRGWLRLAAVCHDPVPGAADGLRDAGEMDRALGVPGLINLALNARHPGADPRMLPSGVPVLGADSIGGGCCELVTVHPDGYVRYVSRDDVCERAQHRFTDVDGVFPRREPGPESPGRGGYRRGDGDPRERADPYREFFDQVAAATRTRFPDADVTERPEEGYLRVTRPLPGVGSEQSLVGVVRGAATEAAVDEFADGVHGRFSSVNPQIRSELVYGSLPAPAALAARARRRGVQLRSFVEYQGLLDLRPLATAQRERLDADRVYPAQLYVEQRYRVVSGGDHRDRIRTGLIGQAADWLRSDVARLVVVLGDFGRGKTSFLRQLTRLLPAELPDLTPVLVELRNLEKGPTLDDLLAQHLVRHGVEDVSTAKLRYMIESGRVALLFDGFDELELRVGYDSAADYLQSLLNSLTGRAKLVLTSRTQHFRSGQQVRTALGERVETRTGGRVVILEDFTEDQILRFLTNLYDGHSGRARQRFELIGHIANLLELTRNPRMLAFVAQLDERRLRAVRTEGDRISAAGLYEEIIDYWLASEEERQLHRRGLAALTKDERFTVCTGLALRLWRSNAPAISLRELTAEVTAILTSLAERGFAGLAERGFTGDQAAHSIASGSLLVRTEDDTFAFVHQSIMEWLVAAHAARELAEKGTATTLSARPASRLMAAFFADIVGLSGAGHWATQTLADPGAPPAAKENAVTVMSQFAHDADAVANAVTTGSPPPAQRDSDRVTLRAQDLHGQDLRGQNLTGQDLTGANLTGANLSGMRLDDIDLTGANLTGANLTGVTMTGGSLDAASIGDSVWTRAALLSTDGLDAVATAPELAAAAIVGRDRAEAMLLPPGECLDVAFSPDGTLLAIAQGTAVCVADAETGTALRVLRGHHGRVNAVAFSPDGARIATASDDNTARIWDTQTGDTLATLTGHDSSVTSVVYSSDGWHIATGSHDRTARIWDTQTGRTLATLTGHRDWIRAVAYSLNGLLLATASDDSTARIWDIRTGRTLATLTGHDNWVNAIAFSPNGASIATASWDQSARIWDVATGTQRTALTGHDSTVTGIAYSPDGTRIATTSGDHTVRLWDVTTGAVLTAPTEHGKWVNAVTYSPDGTRIATASDDNTARIWDTDTRTVRTTRTGHDGRVTSVAFSPDGNSLATAFSDRDARIWDTATGATRTTLTERDGKANAGAFPPDSDGIVTAVAYSPDSRYVATASAYRRVCIWDTRSGGLLTSHPADGQVNAVAVSPDGGTVAAALDHGTVIVWGIRSYERRATLAGHDSAVTAIAYSPDGNSLATASSDRTVRIWDVIADTTRITLAGHDGPLTAVAFSPDGTRIATASSDNTARLWDLTGERQTRVLRLLRRPADLTPKMTLWRHHDTVTAVAFHPSGTALATASEDGTARVWYTADGAERIVFAGHAGPVRSVAFSPDGALLATASDDGTARIWSAADARPLATLLPLPEDGYAILLPDGSYKLKGDPGDRLWWAMKLCRFAPGELDPHIPEIRKLPPDAPILPIPR